MSMPPLPTIPLLRTGEVQIRDFTLLEMQAYAKTHGQQVWEAALEEAAKAIKEPIGYDNYTAMHQAAEKIRRLK